MFGIMMAWLFYMTPSEEEIQRLRDERRVQDSIRSIQADQGFLPEDDDRLGPAFRGATPDRQQVLESMGVFADSGVVDTLFYTIETPFYSVVFTNLGAGPVVFELAQYDRWDGTPVQLIADTTRSAYSLGFVSAQNYNIETNQLLFAQQNPGDFTRLVEGQRQELRYVLELEDGARLIYAYSFNGDNYDIGLDIIFDGIQQHLSDNNIEFGWRSALNTTERSRASEALYSAAFVYSGGVLEEFNLSSAGREENIITGSVNWIATKTKFFTQIIKPETEGTGAIISSEVTGDATDERTDHIYTSTLRTRIPDNGALRFNLYVGPLEYYTIREFEAKAYEMVDVGYWLLNWFSKPFVKFVIIPVLTTLGDWTGSYGLAIILFALLVKIVLYPLTKKSFESMAAMRELQPEMKLLQEKYKEDPKKQQEATLKLFKKAKVNPLGGCLPNLLQLPVLVTLWKFFQNAIEIRGEAFLWANDLSAPDVIINLPFDIPFFGDFVAGFVLLMTVSMVVQFKVSGQGGAGNPQMKVLQYIFPVMLLVIFNQFASGLSLYYLVYNVLSIGQQFMINKKIDHVKMMEGIDKKKAREMEKEQIAEKKKTLTAKKGK
jgi:YidC/Oxa1 family membrane protein insertase